MKRYAQQIFLFEKNHVKKKKTNKSQWALTTKFQNTDIDTWEFFNLLAIEASDEALGLRKEFAATAARAANKFRFGARIPAAAAALNCCCIAKTQEKWVFLRNR